MKNLSYRLPALITALISLSACAPATDSDRATPTIDQTAVVEGRLPTINAQLTQYAQDITQSAPTVQAIMTLVATSGPISPEDVTPVASQPTLNPTSTTSGSIPAATSDTSFDDVNQTTQTLTITVGQTVSGTFATATEAHNYEFQATAGQSITIRAASVNTSDPRIKVFNPSGDQVGTDDDGGGGSSAQLTLTLTTTGTYIIRIDTWGGGGYTLSIE